ncbi:SHOCT domain-containing protein [Mycobacterium sp. CBMA293]|nr:SHOCT domain-containing protein [Mycolicibacterium sp. CBMA 360]MUL58510.1 SHOCT domain-containing protein [Mycolicibacterium sp. CBMA 335]MUL73968.1 SHOCT domain-containing protein [Mycolicibacterium sp. CBMA 311]MUL93393.1 SHOCT domain-containing protein [Mycolicibacterium sp. CBMA 230]MUM04608.1 hypothetical protein [Mycolicibacterium sp. CBMA 213]MUM10236.1 SHOCT domain-containing protein [Mycolicibacterium sp. CBMA 293]
MMFWYNHNMGWWGYAGMGIGMVLFWTLIVVGIIALIRSSTTSTPPDSPQARYRVAPEQLLAERFARGDIDDTDYKQRMTTLRTHGAA